MQNKIVFVWAGWAGMSGLVSMIRDLWFNNLVAIDANQSQLIDNLKDKWINVVIWHGKYDVKPDDIVIYSEAAINSVEVKKTKAFPNNIKKPQIVLNYFEFLGEVSKFFKTIGFSGTNGKSSSTSLAIWTAKDLLPNFGIGILWALVPQLDNQSYCVAQDKKEDLQNIFHYIFTGKKLDYNLIKKYYFLVESCEYKRHFLHLDLDSSIVTNMDLDHTDYYKDHADYLSAFKSMIERLKNKVYVLDVNPDIDSLNVDPSKVIKVKEKEFDFKYLFWKHNNLNGTLVSEILFDLWNGEVSREDIAERMIEFKWLWRRMESLWSTKNGALLFTDYWHVAQSIDIWFSSLKGKYTDKKLVCIFQPHQINRIIKWRDEFPSAIKQYDEKVIYDIYAARESLDLLNELWIDDIQSLEHLGEIFADRCGAKYIYDSQEIIDYINNFDDRFVVVIYTAGDLDYLIRKSL